MTFLQEDSCLIFFFFKDKRISRNIKRSYYYKLRMLLIVILWELQHSLNGFGHFFKTTQLLFNFWVHFLMVALLFVFYNHQSHCSNKVKIMSFEFWMPSLNIVLTKYSARAWIEKCCFYVEVVGAILSLKLIDWFLNCLARNSNNFPISQEKHHPHLPFISIYLIFIHNFNLIMLINPLPLLYIGAYLYLQLRIHKHSWNLFD